MNLSALPRASLTRQYVGARHERFQTHQIFDHTYPSLGRDLKDD
jgi:hypothetical protein